MDAALARVDAVRASPTATLGSHAVPSNVDKVPTSQ